MYVKSIGMAPHLNILDGGSSKKNIHTKFEASSCSGLREIKYMTLPSDYRVVASARWTVCPRG